MPSPFPGMDPFIEGQRWEDFHSEMLSNIRAELGPQVRPRYDLLVQERVYLERIPERGKRFIGPDVTLAEQRTKRPRATGTTVAVAMAVEPIVLTLPMPEQRHEYFLVIRERRSLEVVTLIEVLSPGNKRAGSDGRREYLEKRDAVLVSGAHLIELDLLRGGERLPTLEVLPDAAYYAFVSRRWQRPDVEVYCWSLRQALPTIPVPLARDDADAMLDLQAAFAATYDRAGYDSGLDHQATVEPALDDADAAWVAEILRRAGARPDAEP